MRTLTSLLSSHIFWYRRSASFGIVAPAFSFTNGQIGVEAFLFHLNSFPLSFRTSAFLFRAEVLSPLFLFCS